MVFFKKLFAPARPIHSSFHILETTRAILLRKIRFSDTSLIITWLTCNHGKIKTVAKGALRPKGPFAGILDLFFDCEISFARSSKTELHTLREARLCHTRDSLRHDYPRLALASYFIELLEFATEHDHPAPELYDLLTRALTHLDEKPATQHALLHFERELNRLLGIAQPETTPIIAFARAHHRIPTTRAGLLKILSD